MGSKVYVGNLPFTVDEEQLRTLFAEGGREVLEVNIITDRDTGRPRGFAFVNMANQEDAEAAINSLNGTEVGGRALTVNLAREQQPRGGGGRGGFGGGRGGGGGGGGGRRDRY
ncbi:MAG: RNA-binding protein [candidate division NC10 bacterium]|jgi:RNA recognition motif-containing protein